MHCGNTGTGAATTCSGTTRVTSLNFAAILRHSVDFVPSSYVVKILSFATARTIIRLPIVVLVEKGLDPLTKLKIILILCILKFTNINMALNTVLIKSALEYFVVLYEFVLMFSLPLDSTERESARIQTVHNSAVNCTGSALFDLLNT